MSAAERALAALPDGAALLVDGLAFSPLLEVFEAARRRLRLLVLVHHPLADETGLTGNARDRLFERERRALSLVRGVVVTSATTARRLADFAVPAGRIRVVLPGVATASPQCRCCRPPTARTADTAVCRLTDAPQGPGRAPACAGAIPPSALAPAAGRTGARPSIRRPPAAVGGLPATARSHRLGRRGDASGDAGGIPDRRCLRPAVASRGIRHRRRRGRSVRPADRRQRRRCHRRGGGGITAPAGSSRRSAEASHRRCVRTSPVGSRRRAVRCCGRARGAKPAGSCWRR